MYRIAPSLHAVRVAISASTILTWVQLSSGQEVRSSALEADEQVARAPP